MSGIGGLGAKLQETRHSGKNRNIEYKNWHMTKSQGDTKEWQSRAHDPAAEFLLQWQGFLPLQTMAHNWFAMVFAMFWLIY